MPVGQPTSFKWGAAQQPQSWTVRPRPWGGQRRPTCCWEAPPWGLAVRPGGAGLWQSPGTQEADTLLPRGMAHKGGLLGLPVIEAAQHSGLCKN